MPQIKSQFTPEQKKAFEENTNLRTLLGAINHESLIELFMRQQQDLDIAHSRIDELQNAQKELEKIHNKLVDEVYNPKIKILEKCDALEEMINGIAKNTFIPVFDPKHNPPYHSISLDDKWNSTANKDHK
jgi:predicted nuclease with TOPRIM domain